MLNDGPTPPGVVRVFQHLPPYVSQKAEQMTGLGPELTLKLLVLGGTLFMSATDEEMHNADGLGIDHVTYALFVRPFPTSFPTLLALLLC